MSGVKLYFSSYIMIRCRCCIGPISGLRITLWIDLNMLLFIGWVDFELYPSNSRVRIVIEDQIYVALSTINWWICTSFLLLFCKHAVTIWGIAVFIVVAICTLDLLPSGFNNACTALYLELIMSVSMPFSFTIFWCFSSFRVCLCFWSTWHLWVKCLIVLPLLFLALSINYFGSPISLGRSCCRYKCGFADMSLYEEGSNFFTMMVKNGQKEYKRILLINILW